MTIEYDTSRASWLAHGFEELLDTDGNEPEFDVLIVGSGYGGAIAAMTLAGREHNSNPVKVCILERGSEYLPGMFPTGLAELPIHVRVDQSKEGLFDIRPGPDVTTVVANGVGGGSLINAGVMEVPKASVFEDRWPASLSNLASWESYFDEARELLGAGTSANPNTIADHPDGIPTKTDAIEGIAPSSAFRHAAITVAMEDSLSSGNVKLNQCLACGDCATGCNYGAKISLDVSLLATAHRKGVEIYSGATVLSVEKDTANDQWLLDTVYTNSTLRERLQKTQSATIRAKKVILAAGTLGSTEILKRSESLALSPKLGKHCSTNGDMLVTDYATDDPVDTVANENVRPSDRTIGPTITSVIDLRESYGVLIEEMSVPAGLRRIFTEIFASTNALHRLNKADFSWHQNGYPDKDIYAVRHEDIDRTALYAVMGDDGAEGEIEVPENPGLERDGIGWIKWPGVQELGLFDTQVETLGDLTNGTGGGIIVNPAWNLLPQEMSFLLDNQHGPVVTVHPLGGCVMADSVSDGVVDHLGQVFDASGAGTYHDGLVVLDGAIIPTALATNPALTIAAVALRASETLATQWGYEETVSLPPLLPVERPVARSTDYANEPEGTTGVQVCERMFGDVDFVDANGTVQEGVIELTMRFDELPVSRLAYPDNAGPAEFTLDTAADGSVSASRVRIYDRGDWEAFRLEHVPDRFVEDRLDELAVFNAPLVSGTLRIFERGKSNFLSRFITAGWAYLVNRGFRDIWQAIFDPGGGGSGGLGRLWQRIVGFFRLTTRAGEKRWFTYNLRIGEADPSSDFQLAGDKISGRKLFTYKRRANPWRQLMEMELVEFPGIQSGASNKLDLDMPYLARIGIPLFRVTRQSDGVTALAELGTFVAYLVRMLIGIHIWSFRRPDRDLAPAPVDPRPGPIPGAPPPEVTPIQLDPEVPDGAPDDVAVPGIVRLALYEKPNATKPPVLMLHGYSASGSTFAHHAIPNGLAERLWNSGRDVWIADLRTSACMTGKQYPARPPHLPAEELPATAVKPWSMEQMAYTDVPVAIDYISEQYPEGTKIDVLAHCMGAVMFSMTALADASDLIQHGLTSDQRNRVWAVPGHVRRVAFSQVGPLVVFSPANRFRAYAARYFRELVPGEYSFNPSEQASLADQLLDRVLTTLPYPESEFDYENPKWPCKRTPWTRTRHRMDALYGRDFNVANVSDEMLRHINDHFGALSIETVTQTMHFARYSTITDRTGYNRYVSRSTLTDDRWPFPVLSVHGRDNGLSDVTTIDRMRQILEDAERDFRSHILPNGHQDMLIGDGREQMANAIIDFFNLPDNDFSFGEGNEGYVALTPWIGPVVTMYGTPPQPHLRIGARPSMRGPETVVMLRVQVINDELRRHNDGMPFDAGDENYVLNNMIALFSSNLQQNRWDSFPMPLPPAVPAGGDALLVLVLYAESTRLPMDSEITYLRVYSDSFGRPTQVLELNTATWEWNDDLPPHSTSVEEMRVIARAALSALLEQRGLGAGIGVQTDPNGVLLSVDDPADAGPGPDPIE